MGFFGLFRRQPQIADLEALSDFIDRQAAFLVQKGIYEYARARAGHYSKVLFAEEGFQTAVEFSRWSAYPLGLAMVAEIVEGLLRPHAVDRRQQLDELCALVLTVFDRYPVPAPLGQGAWGEMRAELQRRLDRIGLHPPKRAFDVPAPYVQKYFDLMPIHERLRGRDFPTTHNYLKVSLCNIHEEFCKRMDAPALARALATAGTPIAP